MRRALHAGPFLERKMQGINRRQIANNSDLNVVPINLIRLPLALATHLKSAYDIQAAAVGDVVTAFEAGSKGGLVPDFGRNITITYVDAAGSDGVATLLLTGLNQFGETITESISVTSGGGSTLAAGSKIFSKVTSFEVTAKTSAASDTMNIGFGSLVGLPVQVKRRAMVKSITRDGTLTDIDSDTIDTVYSALKCDGANGAGSNSGVLAANDSFNILVQFDTAEDEDDIFQDG